MNVVLEPPAAHELEPCPSPHLAAPIHAVETLPATHSPVHLLRGSWIVGLERRGEYVVAITASGAEYLLDVEAVEKLCIPAGLRFRRDAIAPLPGRVS